MAKSKEEVIQSFQNALSDLEELDPRIRREILEGDGWVDLLYNKSLLEYANIRIREYFDWRDNNREEKPGQLMEEIAFLLFQSINGIENIGSFQSYAAQHDLVVSGSSTVWQLVMEYLHLPKVGRSIIIEAKNQDSRITDQQFSRLCGLLQNKFSSTAHLGVFVSRTNASGFPNVIQTLRGREPTRERRLRDSRATQALFHAKTDKFVVVLNEIDLRRILDGISFLKIISSKIIELENSSGLELSFTEVWNQVDLPPHLSQHYRLDDSN